MKRLLAFLLLISCAILAAGCQGRLSAFSARTGGERETFSLGVFFDTACTFYIGKTDDSSALAEELSAFLQKLDRLFDVYAYKGQENGLKAVNDNAGKTPVPVADEVFSLLLFSQEISARTGGVFLPTIGAVTRLWKQAQQDGVLPDGDALREAKNHIAPETLVLDGEKKTAYLSDPEARIDVGAVAKGYAAQIASEFLKKKGAENWLLALGGSVTTCGVDPQTGSAWRVGIADPEKKKDAAAFVGISGLSAVTSGVYERYFTVDGIRYHHVIDPKTCAPSESGSLSVTVFSSSAATADVMSTVLLILSPEEGTALLADFPEVSAVRIDAHGTLTASPGAPAFEDEAKNAGSDRIVLLLLSLLLLIAASLLLLRYTKKTGSAAQDPESPKPDKAAQRFSKKDAVALFLCLLAALCLLLACLFIRGNARVSGGDSQKAYAVVRVDGKETAALDLSEDGEYLARTEWGDNLVRVEKGGVSITQADCPGGDCMRTGPIGEDSLPGVIACLPHRLTVTIEWRES